MQLSHSYFPDKFWGIGPGTPDSNLERYQFEQVFINPHFKKRFSKHVFAGSMYEFQRAFNINYTPGGEFDSAKFHGKSPHKVSGGVGFIALFGICIQNGVILISEFHANLKLKMNLETSILAAVRVRTRPVVMTALMAAIGLMPAALSTGIGSESQKPLAVVIIGGLVTATIFTLIIFPIFYYWAQRKKHLPL